MSFLFEHKLLARTRSILHKMGGCILRDCPASSLQSWGRNMQAFSERWRVFQAFCSGRSVVYTIRFSALISHVVSQLSSSWSIPTSPNAKFRCSYVCGRLLHPKRRWRIIHHRTHEWMFISTIDKLRQIINYWAWLARPYEAHHVCYCSDLPRLDRCRQNWLMSALRVHQSLYSPSNTSRCIELKATLWIWGWYYCCRIHCTF